MIAIATRRKKDTRQDRRPWPLPQPWAKKDWTPGIAYIRMSSDDQKESPERQRDELARLAREHKIRIIGEYSDEGISGDSEDRPGFLAIIREAQETRDFAVVLCWHSDRFARFDSITAGKYIHPLREAGVWLITRAQGVIDWNTFAGRMMYSIGQEQNHEFLVNLSRNVLSGRANAAKKGPLLCTPAYGYDRVYYDERGQVARRVPYGQRFRCPDDWTGRLEPAAEEEKVATYKWIMDSLANADWSLRGVATELNRRGIASPRAKLWTRETVRFIAKNPVYLGDQHFGRGCRGKFHHLQDGAVVAKDGRKIPSDPVVTEKTHEPLTDPATFRRVQAKLEQRNADGRRPRMNDYLLAGVLYCGHCGGRMWGHPGSKGRHRRYYRCDGKIAHACPGATVPKDHIEAYVVNWLDEWLQRASTVRKTEAKLHARAKAEKSFAAQTTRLKGKIAALDKKIAKGSENLLLAEPDEVADLKAVLKRWRAERESLHGELEDAVASPAGIDPAQMAKLATEYITRLRKDLLSGEPVKARAVIGELVADVLLFWEPVKVKGRFRLYRGEINLKQPRGVIVSPSSCTYDNPTPLRFTFTVADLSRLGPENAV